MINHDGRITPCPQCDAPNAAGARFCRSCGTALPARRFPLRLPRRTAQVLVGATVVVLVVIGLAFFVVQRGNDPRDPVRAFFVALAARDPARIHAVVECDAICTEGALATGYTPPSEVQIGDVTEDIGRPDDVTRRPDPNIAAVAVKYTVDGVVRDDTIVVVRNGNGLVRDWTLLDAPGASLAVVSGQIPTAFVAGLPVRTVTADLAEDTKHALWVFPGVYAVSAPGTVLARAPSVRVPIGAGGHVKVPLTPQVLPTAAKEVDRLISARLTACAAQADLMPAVPDEPLSCPFRATLVTTPRSIIWTILDLPTITFSPIERPLDQARTFSVAMVKQGRAKVTYEYTLGVIPQTRTWIPAEETVTFDVRGAVGLNEQGAIVWCNSCETELARAGPIRPK